MSLESAAAFLTGTSLMAVAFTFAGYPLLMMALARLFPQKTTSSGPENPPHMTVVMAAHNEEIRIVPRIQNLLASRYPPERLTVIVVSDGSTDATTERVKSLNDPRIRLIIRPVRSGKAACLNAGFAEAAGDIVALCDVRQRFDADTLARLAGHFGDPRVGAASGSLEIESSATSVGGGVDAYWRLEKLLRHAESRFDSAIGCTGAVYAVRRRLYEPLPEDTLLDDVVIPMRIALRGFRVLFDPEARAYDPQTLEPEREAIRKQRTLAGNYQMLFRYPGWLLPWNNRLWWQLASHKYLRLAAPFFLALALAANAAWLNHAFGRCLFAAQCLFYLLALLGAFLPGRKSRLLSLPSGFLFLNLMALSGLWHHWRGTYRGGRWPAAGKRTSNPS